MSLKMASGSSQPDMSLIGELLEDIERNPQVTEARRLLMQLYMDAGWFEAAGDTAKELLQIDSLDAAAIACYAATRQKAVQPVPKSRLDTSSVQGLLAVPSSPEERDAAVSKLSKGYQALRARAKALQQQLHLLRDLEQKMGIVPRRSKYLPDLVALADGRVSSVVRVLSPSSARAVARSMESARDKALDIAVKDLEDMARWLRSSRSPDLDNDAVRDALVKRVRALSASLVEELQPYTSLALMHIEHEVLGRTYACTETMLGDPVADIPRAHFWVSEDGYAWDMEELVQALTSNSGVMRNPLSRQLFTPNDVRAIVSHPLGGSLAALQIEQSKLAQGVRPETIDKLEILAATLLADMSLDQVPSRHAIDDFLAYAARLPKVEEKAIDKLRVAARDSHTGQPFDVSIGEAVRDALGNRVCLHKTGDFLSQAAKHLRNRP